jgi:hypothetical protein
MTKTMTSTAPPAPRADAAFTRAAPNLLTRHPRLPLHRLTGRHHVRTWKDRSGDAAGEGRAARSGRDGRS